MIVLNPRGVPFFSSPRTSPGEIAEERGKKGEKINHPGGKEKVRRGKYTSPSLVFFLSCPGCLIRGGGKRERGEKRKGEDETRFVNISIVRFFPHCRFQQAYWKEKNVRSPSYLHLLTAEEGERGRKKERKFLSALPRRAGERKGEEKEGRKSQLF